MIAQKISNRAIAIPGCTFRGKHLLIDAQLAAGEPAQHCEDSDKCILPLGVVNQPRAGDGASIDHRIEGPTSSWCFPFIFSGCRAVCRAYVAFKPRSGFFPPPPFPFRHRWMETDGRTHPMSS